MQSILCVHGYIILKVHKAAFIVVSHKYLEKVIIWYHKPLTHGLSSEVPVIQEK